MSPELPVEKVLRTFARIELDIVTLPFAVISTSPPLSSVASVPDPANKLLSDRMSMFSAKRSMLPLGFSLTLIYEELSILI